MREKPKRANRDPPSKPADLLAFIGAAAVSAGRGGLHRNLVLHVFVAVLGHVHVQHAIVKRGVNLIGVGGI